MKVGVIGLGSMGMGTALNLLRKGHVVTGCEVRAEAREAFAAEGGTVVSAPDELPGDIEAVIVFVINAAQTEAVLFGERGCLRHLRPGGVILCCATVAPEAARSLGKRIEESGFLMLDSPVSGGSVGARGGTMTVMASGSDTAFAKAAPVLEAISTKVWRLGTEIGVGSTVKMVNQLLAGVHIATAAEALALGVRAGADPETLYKVISESAGSSWMWQNRVPHILEGDDTPHSAVNIFVKDLGIVLDQARALTFPLPMAAAAHQLFLAAAANGQGFKDDAFVIRVWQALAGINLPSKSQDDGSDGSGKALGIA
ncbi:L-threonate dehydrogenase [Rhodopila sp.]|uniref:L-threonate dehydrogenase n=1 Tax=Rhodopila sp. TaxID=2480087 RepID=UPI002CD5B805|nr:L-threonate dehydrogenase [Rhodopila sp.]HVZ09340.1 L-threonate dehydrogenase [Rhodopila sp.]